MPPNRLRPRSNRLQPIRRSPRLRSPPNPDSATLPSHVDSNAIVPDPDVNQAIEAMITEALESAATGAVLDQSVFQAPVVSPSVNETLAEVTTVCAPLSQEFVMVQNSADLSESSSEDGGDWVTPLSTPILSSSSTTTTLSEIPVLDTLPPAQTKLDKSEIPCKYASTPEG
jgi:hypothetical protein